MAGLREIAEATGLSVRTVSRVLSGSGSFSDKARNKVLDAAKRLDYRPNLHARCLKTRRSCEIILLVHTLADLHLPKIQGLENHLRAQGYWLSLLMQRESDADDALLEEALGRQPAGLALLSPSPREITRAADSGLPYIVLESTLAGYDSVNIDRPQGVYDAVRHLHATGRRRIAYASCGRPEDTVNFTRLSGYLRAMTELGLPPLILPGSPNMPGGEADQFPAGREIARRWEELPAKPDAVQAFSDYQALGLLAGFYDRGLRVPEAVAVVGFDDRPAAARSAPPLTTVAQPHSEVGARAAQILLAKIAGEAAPAGGWSCLLPTRLVIRETT